MLKKVDYLIVGQGIAGSVLALELIKHGKTVLVLNEEKAHTSSVKAGGLYNPITGREMKKTWLADSIFDKLEPHYQELENLLSGQFLFPKPIYRPFFTIEEQNDWHAKAADAEYKPYVKNVHSKSIGIPHVADPYGGIELNKSGHLDLPAFLSSTRKYLTEMGSYLSGVFQYEQVQLVADRVTYNDIETDRVVFCEGPDGEQNPFFPDLKFKLVKGEVLDIQADIPTSRIINRGVFMIPKDGFIRVGSTYDHSQLNHKPTERGKTQIIEKLEKIYSGRFTIVAHRAGVRPATFDRKPYIGQSKLVPQIGFFNGFGAKGVSLVPFFATQYVNFLLGKGELSEEVALDR